MALVADSAFARADDRGGVAGVAPGTTGGPSPAVPAPWKPPDLRARAYDIVVSYRRQPPDLDWVRQQLIPRLRDIGLSVFVDAEGIPGGADWRATIADAIDQCRHVIVVLSPEWVSSGECFSEAIAAFQLDPLGVKRKVIPLHLRECFEKLPDWLEWLKRRNFLDFRNALENANAATGIEWGKLFEACRANLVDEAPSCPLDRLASSPIAVAKCSGILHGQLQPIRARVATIGQYKDLHEFFHRLEAPWIQVEECLRELGGDVGNRRAWREIQRQFDVIVPGVNELTAAATRTLGDESDRVVGLLIQGMGEIQRVLAERLSAAPPPPEELVERMGDAARDIRDELARQPPLLNEAIVQNARNLALDDLLAPLRDLGDALRDEVAVDLLKELDDFLHSLLKTQESLETHVEMHDALQVLHDELIRLDPEDWATRDDFRRQWRGPERRLNVVRAPTPAAGASAAGASAAGASAAGAVEPTWRELPWARELVAIGEHVSQLVKVATLNLDDARDKFELFRSRVFGEFRAVDHRLREQCTPQVRQLVEKLTAALTTLDAAAQRV